MSSAPLDASQIALLSVAAGLLSHWGYFIHGEHHKDGVFLLNLSALLPSALFGFLYYFTDAGLGLAVYWTAVACASYLLSLGTSIVAYRLFFHRLRNFPGPFWMKISKLQHFSLLIAKRDNFAKAEKWRLEYGDFVRTGPNELTIFHPDAVAAVHGPGSKCTKAPWYDTISTRGVSLQTTRIKADHDRERRIWDRGFNSKALVSYESRILSTTKDLLDQISNHAGQVIDITKWVGLYTVDVMTDFAFGQHLHMVKSGEESKLVGIIHDGMKVLGRLGAVPWLMIIFACFEPPALKTFLGWSLTETKKREQLEVTVPDVMSHLITASKQNPDEESRLKLLGSAARLLMVAGSDTTAASLNCAFYQLAVNPEHVRALRAELKLLSPGDLVLRDIQQADHLNGIINEVLRLHPPVPSGAYRVTPSEGLTIANTYIPGNTTVIIPPYSIQRLESCFVRADEFIPERWYSQPELIKNKAAFAPFSIGPYSCVGKQIALMEIRAVLAEVLSRFDVSLAPGEKGDGIHDPEDAFTLNIPGLNVIFTPVKTGSA